MCADLLDRDGTVEVQQRRLNIVVVGGPSGPDGRANTFAHKFRLEGHEVVVCTPYEALSLEADLFVISPEVPLNFGCADWLRSQGKIVVGPGVVGAQLEASKAIMKDWVTLAGIATATYMTAYPGCDLDVIEAFIRDELGGAAYVKESGLAAGKGATGHDTLEDAMADIHAKLKKGKVVVERFIKNSREASVFFFCYVKDGKVEAVPFGTGVDYKKSGDGDEGDNTGGIGAYSPAVNVDEERVLREFVMPILRLMAERGIDYVGFLYVGLMITEDNEYYLLEYNIRFGDPEAQVVLLRITSDLGWLLMDAAAGNLRAPTFSGKPMVGVVLCSENYPGKPVTGYLIEGIEDARAVDGVVAVIEAGVSHASGRPESSGGRILMVVAEGTDIPDARQKAYDGMGKVSCRGSFLRSDIAKDVGEAA
jgi:phosphoribosylamine--glycine ligase